MRSKAKVNLPRECLMHLEKKVKDEMEKGERFRRVIRKSEDSEEERKAWVEMQQTHNNQVPCKS